MKDIRKGDFVQFGAGTVSKVVAYGERPDTFALADQPGVFREKDLLLLCKTCHATEPACYNSGCGLHRSLDRHNVKTVSVAPKVLNLLDISRTGSTTEVSVWQDHDWKPWIYVGEANLNQCEGRRECLWSLKAYMGGGATDFGHDSAQVLRLPLMAVEFKNSNYGVTTLKAIIAEDSDGFRVPPQGYNPLKFKSTTTCKDCDEEHAIVPEGYYVPRHDPALYQTMLGRCVQVSMGAINPEYVQAQLQGTP